MVRKPVHLQKIQVATLQKSLRDSLEQRRQLKENVEGMQRNFGNVATVPAYNAACAINTKKCGYCKMLLRTPPPPTHMHTLISPPVIGLPCNAFIPFKLTES